MWKSLGQRLNLCYSSDFVGSLTARPPGNCLSGTIKLEVMTRALTHSHLHFGYKIPKCKWLYTETPSPLSSVLVKLTLRVQFLKKELVIFYFVLWINIFT